jgi:N utilization substance protein B
MMGRDPEVTKDAALQFYEGNLDKSQELYLFNLLNLLKTTECSIEDTERKKTKYLPSEEDKKFTSKLYHNDLIQALVKEEDLMLLFKKKSLGAYIDEDAIRNYYKGFAKTREYKDYVYQGKGEEAHRNILLSLFKYLIKSEVYQETMEDYYTTWEDDKSLIIGAIKKTLKALPDTPEMYRVFRPDYEASIEFGLSLLEEAIDKDKELEATISPHLENWEMDRVANIDMVLLKMGLVEFLNFPTIPTKVTLNEYVEISKMYCTDKSKDFVNGILDKLMKVLTEEGKISKEGRGLVD